MSLPDGKGKCLILPLIRLFFLYTQTKTGESSRPMIEAGAGLTSLKPHQRIADEMKRSIDLEPNHRGLAIVVPSHMTTHILRETLRFAVYEPQNKTSLKSHLKSVDLVELKHRPIIVMVSAHGVWWDNLVHTHIGAIDINADIMAPLFPPIATHLADNPKIFLFIVKSDSSKRHALHFVEAIWENCIVGYIACDYLVDIRRAADIVQDKLAHPSMSVQEIFTSISDKVPPTVTMTVIYRLKGPVYLYPREPELMGTHSKSPGIVTCL